MGDKNLLKQILKEQQKTNELLQTIVSSKEQILINAKEINKTISNNCFNQKNDRKTTF